MIYGGNVYDLSDLGLSLRKYGLSENAVCVFIDYMDMSKDRDNELLKHLTAADFTRNQYFSLYYGVERYIIKKHDNELTKRYVIFCFAAAGTQCGGFLGALENHAIIKEALREWYADKPDSEIYAEAAVTAIFSNASKGNIYNCRLAEICLVAAKISLDRMPKDAFFLCIAALDMCDTKETSSITKQIVDFLKQLMSGKYGDLKLNNVEKKAALAEMAYFDDDSRRKFREIMSKNPEHLIEAAIQYNLDIERICKLVVSEGVEITDKYVSWVMTAANESKNIPLANEMLEANRKKYCLMKPHLQYLAKNYEKFFIYGMRQCEDARKAKSLLNILSDVNPNYGVDNDGGIKEAARRRLIQTVCRNLGESNVFNLYLHGKKSLDEISDELTKVRFTSRGNYNYFSSTYYMTYGMDETVRKCVTLIALSTDYDYMVPYNISSITGLNYKKTDEDNKRFAAILFGENAPVSKILTFDIVSEHITPYADKIAEADFPKLTAEARCQYINVLYTADADKYRDKIFAAADDTSKAVRSLLAKAVPCIPNCKSDVEEMLSAKKAAKRETALEIIANMPDTDWTEALTAALEKEKSEKLRVRIAAMLGAETSGGDTKKNLTVVQLAEEMTKGNKTRKLAWLYQSPYRPVHFSSGEEASEKYMQAILLCYSSGESKNGKLLAEALNTAELTAYASEVMGRWLDGGAAAKEKWVLIFAAIWGGSEMIAALVHYIKYWSENMRGAMAVAAVKALALNGTSEALMQVDSFARKFKSNQVKAAANEAMAEAAEFLGITAEELADRIVPDMGFDDRMCRTFDYGGRQFSVYLTPSLEIEIYNGEKKIKNLPKPGVNDTAEIAEKSYAEFKEMKKQLKTAVSVQKARLEYALMCERKWTTEGWEKLFVKNPVMHCFAVGLIWGVYEDGELKNTFRYMDDGSFTTADEDEFELPENAVISLVHPVELTEEEISAWSEQLADYEIVQPFPQLSRTVYRPEAEELEKAEIIRFNGKSLVNLTLMSRLLKNGWYKGTAQDAGFFYEFTRKDVARRVKNEKGESVPEGWGAELRFSGMYIGAYSEEAEDVTVEELIFYKAAHMNAPIPAKDVNKRYFSEIIMQLTDMLDK